MSRYKITIREIKIKVTFMANGKREIEVENFSQQKISG